MPQRLANIQPPLTVSSLSLVKAEGENPQSSHSAARLQQAPPAPIILGMNVAMPGAGGQCPICPVVQQLE